MAKKPNKKNERIVYEKKCPTCKKSFIQMCVIQNSVKKKGKKCDCGIFIRNQKIC